MQARQMWSVAFALPAEEDKFLFSKKKSVSHFLFSFNSSKFYYIFKSQSSENLEKSIAPGMLEQNKKIETRHKKRTA